jgi:hypothetical protein
MAGDDPGGRNKGGSTSFVAWVCVKPSKPVARAFKSRSEASAWADDHARQLRKHRSRRDADADLTRLTLAQRARKTILTLAPLNGSMQRAAGLERRPRA